MKEKEITIYDHAVVKKATILLQEDILKITGKKPDITLIDPPQIKVK